ncbi:MAG: phosphoribosyltransferase family protein [Hydrogenophaga sp.]|nr:phosphoribosyltransferase family protein [Hydrogenophaga sp.]
MLFTWRTLLQPLPGICQVCGGWPARPVCKTCARRFAGPAERCRSCAAPVPEGLSRCGACLTRAELQPLQACAAAVDYAYPWDHLIARFKFRGEPGWATPFAQHMLRSAHARDLLAQCGLMVPVPLTPTRLAERGHNQAWELVKAVQQQARLQRLALPALASPDALVRLVEAPDQHSLSREQRLQNLRGVFAAHPGRVAHIRAAHVLLVDDVTTTGATLHAGAQALLQAGAAQVSALVFARTPPPD